VRLDLRSVEEERAAIVGDTGGLPSRGEVTWMRFFADTADGRNAWGRRNPPLVLFVVPAIYVSYVWMIQL
jgi:hypothetical protein